MNSRERLSEPKLSIGITTFNRGSYIEATLRSIVEQLTDECELVVLDAASSDNTPEVVEKYASKGPSVRYIRQDANNGLDRDFNRVVELARGNYCWLIPDDDLLKPGAVARVLREMRKGPSLIVVNTEIRDFSMRRTITPRWLSLERDLDYGTGEMERLIFDTGSLLRYLGCMIFERELWLFREKERHYGSMFVNLWILFQQELPHGALMISDPLVIYRMGNSHTFSSKMFEIFMIHLPSIVWSLPISNEARRRICAEEPWRDYKELLLWRGWGDYSKKEFRHYLRPRSRSATDTIGPALIAVLPGSWVNAALMAYFRLFKRGYTGPWQPEAVVRYLKESPFYFRNVLRRSGAWCRSASREMAAPDASSR